jgi:demethylmenaquinone methyltransferase/2-methoxy-6-polyprenyl-1,4-benzoquinol methylase
VSGAVDRSGSPRPGSGEMFDALAARYDLLNRIISLGMDQGWRRRAVAAMQLGPGMTALDLATGTGDLAIRIARTHADVTVLATDPSRGMLDVAVEKARPLGDRIRFSVGDAQAIDLPDGAVDAVSIAFGIRNVEDRPRALREMARVTRPGGRVVVLELSEPERGPLAALARFHIHRVVPRIGAALSGSAEYAYLQRSIAAFPPPQVFAAAMSAAGLRMIEVAPMSFGSVCLFVATPAGVAGAGVGGAP